MGKGRPGLATSVNDRCVIAFRCGFDCYHPEGSVAVARRQVERNYPQDLLNEREKAAYDELMPATWWVNFERGWETAARQHGARVVDGD